jgi:radical SAM protein (TIGR01212 family)
MPESRYRSLNSELRRIFGGRVCKVSINAGFTCPNRDGTKGVGGCIFCSAEGIRGKSYQPTSSITDQLQAGLAYLAKRYQTGRFIAYFQENSNTYADVATLERYYREALAYPGVVGLAIGTRPDCIDKDILDLLATLHKETYLWIEYGLQSSHDTTLAFINRGHTRADFVQAVEQTKARGIRVVAHIILGLPGENIADMIATARMLAELGVDGVKIHSLHVIKETKLDEYFQAGLLRCPSLNEYAGMACAVLEHLPPTMVIHRLSGHCPPQILRAPDWTLDKNGVVRRIEDMLTAQATFQGKYYHHKEIVS